MAQDKYSTFLDEDFESEDENSNENNLSQGLILKKLAKATSSTPFQSSSSKKQQGNSKAKSASNLDFLDSSDGDVDVVDKENTSVESGIQSFNQGETSTHTEADKSDIKKLKDLMLKMVKQNEDIIERLQHLEDENNKKKKTSVMVPNDVRYKVRQSYEERVNRGLEVWNIEDNKGAFHDDNLATTTYGRNFVSGLYPNLENKDSIINSAIKTYFASKVTTARQTKKHPEQGKEAAKTQRNIHKAERKRSAFKIHVNLKDEELKENCLSVIVPEMMSSEEETEDENGKRYFRVKKPSFHTKKYAKLLKLADDAYSDHMSKRSRNQMVPGEVASPSKRPRPTTLKFGYDMFIKK